MKKMIVVFISLIIVYIILEISLIIFNKGYKIEYKIKTSDNIYNIKETRVKNTKKEYDNYYIEIKINNSIFAFQTFNNLNNKKVIKDIKYYKDDKYECILPVFNKQTILFDITCKMGDSYVYYHNMINKPQELKDFASSLDIYDEKKFIDTKEEIINEGMYNIYKDNLIKEHYLAFTTYQGLTTINKNKIVTTDIFNTDKYTRNLDYFINDFYITADYNENYEFNKFYIVNIKTNKLKELKDKYNISFDSYIQGSINNDLYLFDLDNKAQYKVNLKHMNIEKVGSIKKGIQQYEDGKWVSVNINDIINNNTKFKDNKKIVLENGDIVYTLGNKKAGFIYTFQKKNDSYALYQSNVQNPNIKNYLFDVSSADNVIYIDDYIYFKDKDIIYYYSGQSGKRKIVQSDELLFNNNLLFTVIK